MPPASNSTLYLASPPLHFSAVIFLFPPLAISLVYFIGSQHWGELPAAGFISTSSPIVTTPTTTSHWEMLILISGFAISAQTLLDRCAGLSIRLFSPNQVGTEPMCQTCFVFMTLSCAVSKSSIADWEVSVTRCSIRLQHLQPGLSRI